eukprot:scaffold61521_cov66-Cyclotella_meneghiniana.AAC.1
MAQQHQLQTTLLLLIPIGQPTTTHQPNLIIHHIPRPICNDQWLPAANKLLSPAHPQFDPDLLYCPIIVQGMIGASLRWMVYLGMTMI